MPYFVSLGHSAVSDSLKHFEMRVLLIQLCLFSILVEVLIEKYKTKNTNFHESQYYRLRYCELVRSYCVRTLGDIT